MESLNQSLNRLRLSTSSVTVLSHTHGRERRITRDIDKRELQAAGKARTLARTQCVLLFFARVGLHTLIACK